MGVLGYVNRPPMRESILAALQVVAFGSMITALLLRHEWIFNCALAFHAACAGGCVLCTVLSLVIVGNDPDFFPIKASIEATLAVIYAAIAFLGQCTSKSDILTQTPVSQLHVRTVEQQPQPQ